MQLDVLLNLMVPRHGASPRKDLNLVLYACKTKATGKHLCCGFPIEYFHCFSQRLCACVSSSPYGRPAESRFSLWGPSGSVQTGGIYTVFPLCGHLLLRGTLYLCGIPCEAAGCSVSLRFHKVCGGNEGVLLSHKRDGILSAQWLPFQKYHYIFISWPRPNHTAPTICFK